MATTTTLSTSDAVLHTFGVFSEELDKHNDRRERLVKTSRDVTILSKRVIFLLHRLASDVDSAAAPDAQAALKDAVAQGRHKLAEVQALFRGMRDDLADGLFWRYQSAVSPGLQEYIEALAFAHYLEHDALITFEQVQASLGDEHAHQYFPLPLEEYLLGVSDLTGELMRFAITAIGRRGGRTKAREVSDFVRNCKADFDGFTPYVKNLGKKQAVTAQSLLKIEDAAYAIAVRASEYGDSEEMLDAIVGRCVSDVRRKQGRTEGCDGEASDYMYEEY
ncbi:hypothetical protein M0805_008325 [Coniferiporia weirii]|nr:hypothetical protein M0805_008325 [Coniferiporia weirii]